MKSLLKEVPLLNRHTDRFEQSGIYQGIEAQNLEEVRPQWEPMLNRRRADFDTWIAAAKGDVQDAHWNWAEKAAQIEGSLRHEMFSIECKGQTQGLMLIDKLRFGRLPGQHGRDLIYVEFLTTAPWNRRGIVARPHYRGVGKILMFSAISVSVDEGFGGRVGLHSLPQAEGWYSDFGLSDLGCDQSKEGLRYFELSEAKVSEFLRQDGERYAEVPILGQMDQDKDS